MPSVFRCHRRSADWWPARESGGFLRVALRTILVPSPYAYRDRLIRPGRVERRRKWTAQEKAALLAEVEAERGKVTIVSRRLES
jgi:hypothetical protein